MDKTKLVKKLIKLHPKELIIYATAITNSIQKMGMMTDDDIEEIIKKIKE